ncbi:hypothetical protein FACS1894122_02790 [Alphaproteobacteria bacterium]|nr:hypothetical protein FACS1894122_02790 [Alphaproteobacteria bacterium]
MSNKLGRNELCYCGSGKKYKKCCLQSEVSSAIDTVAATDLKWYQFRCMEGTVIDKHLVPYVTKKLPRGVIESAYEDFLQDEELPKGVDEELFFGRFFTPWCLFNWIPCDDFGVEDFNAQETLAENYLRLHRNRLSSKERLFIETMVHETYYSFYCVLDVEIDKRLTVRDTLLETVHTVKESQGTRQLERGDVLFGRILTMEDQSIFVGLAPFRMGPEYLHKLIDFREILLEGKETLSVEDLRDESQYLFGCFLAFLNNMFNKPPPILVNTDDELVVFAKSRFKLMIAPEEALNCLLPLTLGAELDYLLEEAEMDKSGKVKKIEFSWLKEGNKKHKAWDNTILGNIIIEKGKLTLETNSKERAKLGKELLEEYLGDKISFQSISAKTPEQEMRSLKKSNSKKEEEADEELEKSPEVKEMLRNMAEEHWTNWFDEPIPLLKDETPRQAAKTKEGRERLEALLMEYEHGMNDDDNDDNPFKADIEYLRKELCLDS